jgi:hypothetical protein
VRWSFADKDAGSPNSGAIRATEDAAQRASRVRRRHRLLFVRPPFQTDEHAAGDDEERAGEEPAADKLARPQQQHRDEHAPERLRRDERTDDGDAAAVVRREEREVGKTEEHAGRRKRPQ